MSEKICMLKDSDLDSNGNFVQNFLYDYPLLLFVQSESCGHCKKALPEVIKFAETYYPGSNPKEAIVLTIVMGNDSKSVLNKIQKQIGNIKGVPHYVLFNNGKMVKDSSSLPGRSFENLKNFVFN